MDTLKAWTIYCHTHIESGRCYVGLTSKTVLARWNQHVNNAAKKTGKGCRHFWNTIRKYGKEAFSHEILEICYDLDQANLAEDYWIEKLDTRNPEKGFNLARGGGIKPDLIRRNPWNDSEYRAKMTQVMQSDEFRSAHKAACNSPENAALRKSALAIQFSNPEHRFRLANAMKGVVLSDESRAKISESNCSRVCTEDTRQKLSVAGTGRKPSPEHAAKLRSMGAARAAALKARTHCKHGHSLADAMIRRSDNERICRTCSRLRGDRYRLKKHNALPLSY